MNTDQDRFKSKQENQERTSATTSNGLSADSGDSNEEIIELTDIIKKGKGFENSDIDFKFERAPAQADSGSDTILGPDDDNLEKIIAGLESELELEETETIQDREEPVSPTPEVYDEAPVMSAGEEEEAGASSHKTDTAEAPIIEAEEETGTTPPASDEATVLSEEGITASEEDRPSLPQPDEVTVGFQEEMAETDMTPEEAPDVTLSISDEQIERILTPMVREVIERTVRKTVAEVAERVIKEAIDSLKESIEPPRE